MHGLVEPIFSIVPVSLYFYHTQLGTAVKLTVSMEVLPQSMAKAGHTNNNGNMDVCLTSWVVRHRLMYG